jgi:hypothetical protein
MRKYFKKYLIFVLAVFLACGVLSIIWLIHQSSYPRQSEKAYKEYKRKILRAPSVSQTYASDIEIQLGLASLYSWLGTPAYHSGKDVNSQSTMLMSQFEKVISLDPNCRALWAQKAFTDMTSLFNGERISSLLLREDIIAAQHEGLEKKISVPLKLWTDQGWRYQDKEIVLDINIGDINTILEPVRKMYQKEMLKVIPKLEKIQVKYDPNNGLYNYFRAEVYFEIEMEEKAIQEVNVALDKEYFESYDTQLFNAANRTLKILGVSNKSIELLNYKKRQISSWIYQIVITENLERILSDIQTKGDKEKASDIEKLLSNSQKQIGFRTPFD